MRGQKFLAEIVVSRLEEVLEGKRIARLLRESQDALRRVRSPFPEFDIGIGVWLRWFGAAKLSLVTPVRVGRP